jgi:hypothetical protein
MQRSMVPSPSTWIEKQLERPLLSYRIAPSEWISKAKAPHSRYLVWCLDWLGSETSGSDRGSNTNEEKIETP